MYHDTLIMKVSAINKAPPELMIHNKIWENLFKNIERGVLRIKFTLTKGEAPPFINSGFQKVKATPPLVWRSKHIYT